MTYRQDTEGFSYTPYRLHPASGDLVPITLREIVRDKFLPEAVTWLLGYDAASPLAGQIHHEPIRAQANCSHWETAWCLYYLTDLIDAPKGLPPALLEEIQRRLVSEKGELSPLVWLLSEAKELEDKTIRWYGKEYDTAVVTLALLRVKLSGKIQFPKSVRDDLDRILPGALRGLFKSLERDLENGKRNDEAFQVIEPLIWAATCFPELWGELGLDPGRMRMELYAALDRWISYGEACLPKEKGPPARAIGGTEAHCLCRLVFLHGAARRADRETARKLAERAQSLLVHYVEDLEASLVRDQWGGTLDRAWRLGTYINACQAAALDLETGRAGTAMRNPLSAHVVLKVFATIKTEVFNNGSVFNTVYATVYFFRALVILLEWQGSERNIVDFYDELLDRAVTGTLERQVNFEIRRLLLQSDRELKEARENLKAVIARERKKRFLLLVLVWLSLTAAALFAGWSYLEVSDFFSLAGGVVALLAVILYLLEVAVLRET